MNTQKLTFKNIIYRNIIKIQYLWINVTQGVHTNVLETTKQC